MWAMCLSVTWSMTAPAEKVWGFPEAAGRGLGEDAFMSRDGSQTRYEQPSRESIHPRNTKATEVPAHLPAHIHFQI